MAPPSHPENRQQLRRLKIRVSASTVRRLFHGELIIWATICAFSFS